jgi:hypothetical protein
MREAWEPSWQRVRAPGASSDEPTSLKLPVTAAAAQLGLGVFASGPLGEGSLLDDRQLLVCPVARPACASVACCRARMGLDPCLT